jgi:hypothetical protein
MVVIQTSWVNQQSEKSEKIFCDLGDLCVLCENPFLSQSTQRSPRDTIRIAARTRHKSWPLHWPPFGQSAKPALISADQLCESLRALRLGAKSHLPAVSSTSCRALVISPLAINHFQTLPLRRFSALNRLMPTSMPMTSLATQPVLGLKASVKPYLP